MARSFYRDRPPDLLSQGDIAADVPWGLIEAPTALCRPADRRAPNGKARYSLVEPWTVPNSPAPWSRDPEIIHAIGWSGLVMVLWHDCQIEKSDNQERDRADKASAAVAPLNPLTELQSVTPEKTAELHESVKAGDHNSYFYLPAVAAGKFSLPESVVNLRFIWSVRQSTLSNRPASIDPEMLFSLYEKLFVFFTRHRLDLDPTCPTCGSKVPLVSAND